MLLDIYNSVGQANNANNVGNANNVNEVNSYTANDNFFLFICILVTL